MRRKYGNISNAVKSVVRKYPYIIPCLSMGIINYSKLASQIKGDVDTLLDVDVNIDSIKMSLIRYSRELETYYNLRDSINVLSGSSLQLISDVVLVTVELSTLLNVFDKILSILSGRRFIQITQGRNTATLVMEYNVYEDLTDEFKDVISIMDNKAAILIVSPEDIIYTPGVIYLISCLLYVNKINITQIISSYIDTIIIVDRAHGSKACEVIDEFIKWYRGGSNGDRTIL
ncbi:hypothetical protein DRN84_01255 [Candidatus Geothermarchaeota archaeon]|nr:MAG: hypothetical protein DRN87_06220 [Candidatus Geothermarchaeota archaeon]RLG62676.1 MAG: hypothetical protein DRN84_01255 [Candidatus Geothermarchaeota archaeon]